MQRDPAYLLDMLSSARLIVEYVGSSDEAAFFTDTKTQDAVIRKFEIIGVAAKRVSNDTTQLMPEIDWKGYCGFRDVLIHQYDEVSLPIVWKSVREEIPLLIQVLQRHLRSLGIDPDSAL